MKSGVYLSPNDYDLVIVGYAFHNEWYMCYCSQSKLIREYASFNILAYLLKDWHYLGEL